MEVFPLPRPGPPVREARPLTRPRQAAILWRSPGLCYAARAIEGKLRIGRKAVRWQGTEQMALEIGSEAEGTVFKILNIGALVRLPEGHVGLVHISEIAHEYVRTVEDYLHEGDAVRVKVMGVNDQERYELSIKALEPAPEGTGEHRRGGGRSADLDEKLAEFQKRSQQRMSAVRKREGRRRGRRA